MTELEEFLTALYDSIAEAEVQALQHGHRRLEEALEAGVISEDASLPVYHATDIEVDLDVGLKAKIENGQTKLIITEESERAEEAPSGLQFDLEVFDLLDRADLEPRDRPDDRKDEAGPTSSHRVQLKPPTVEEADVESESEYDRERGSETETRSKTETEIDGTEEPDDGGETDSASRPEDDDIDEADAETDADEPAEEPTTDPPDLTVLTGIGEAKAKSLRAAGFETLADVRAASPEDLATVDGIWMDLARRVKAEATDVERRVEPEADAGVNRAEPDEPVDQTRARDHEETEEGDEA